MNKYQKKELKDKDKTQKLKNLISVEIEKIDLYNEVLEKFKNLGVLEDKIKSNQEEINVIREKKETTLGMLKKFENTILSKLRKFCSRY